VGCAPAGPGWVGFTFSGSAIGVIFFEYGFRRASDELAVLLVLHEVRRRVMLDLPHTRARSVALLVLALFFVLAGANHFVNPGFYVAIVPPYLPAHLELVYVSGFLEMLGGASMLVGRARRVGGLGLILLLVAVFPANVHMALHPELFPGLSARALYARLPVQLLLIAWVYWVSRPGSRSAASNVAQEP